VQELVLASNLQLPQRLEFPPDLWAMPGLDFAAQILETQELLLELVLASPQ
jgi:hypothetical protein